MGTATTTIDLGELPREGPTEVEGAPPAESGRRRRRGWLAGATTALVVLSTGAAAAAPPAWAIPHFTVPATDFFELTDQVLYAIDASDPARPVLTAYRLDDGRLAWEAHSPSITEQYTVLAGIPMYVTSRVVELDGTSWHVYESTTVLDPQTGEERWTREGFPTAVLAGDLLVMEHQPTGPETPTIAVVELATGRVLWSLPAESQPEADWSHPDRARYVVVLAEHRLTSYDLRTGARLATTTVAAAGANVSVVGTHALVSEVELSTITAYDLRTLQRRWVATVPEGRLTGCGELLCGYQADGLYAVDPVTGERAWTAPWLRELSIDAYELPAPWPSGLLLTGDWVVDAGTGEPVLELTDWQVAYDAWWGAPVPQPALVRYQPATEGGLGITWFGRPRADPPGVEVLGAVEGAPNDCLLNARYLVCRKATELHVWRLQR